MNELCWVVTASLLGQAPAAGIPAPSPPAATEAFHLDAETRARIQKALDRAADRLVREQDAATGRFRSPKEGGVPPVPLTAMALWALSEAGDAPEHRAAGAKAAAYLLGFRQPDGGIYDPAGGLVRYTASITRRALEAWTARHPDPSLRKVLDGLNLFAYRNLELESLEEERARPSPGVNAKAVERLRGRADLSPEVKKALDFLWNSKEKPAGRPLRRSLVAAAHTAKDALTYDEFLRYVSEMTRFDNPTVSKAHLAIRSYYSFRENPDLTRRYGPEGFQRKDAGLYYYYLTVARTLGAVGRPELKTLDGRSHDWARELSGVILSLQSDDGSWVNRNDRWWEDDAVLVTAYAMIALRECRDVKRSAR